MKSLFITGASGFLGAYLLKQIEPSSYHSVILVSRRRPQLPDVLANADNVIVIESSLDKTEQYIDHLDENCDVIHMAASTGNVPADQYFSINAGLTETLVRAAKQKKVRGFVYLSSIAVSFTDRRGYLYADSKEAAEQIVKDSGIPYCILRPTIILGKEAPIWEKFYQLSQSSLILLPGNGKVVIQPIHAMDMASIVLDIVNSNRFNNEMLEMGGPESLTIDNFVSRIHQQSKSTTAKILHLPLAPILLMLRTIEKINPDLLPVNSGQFASFKNDGIATDNDLLSARKENMKDMQAMLDEFIAEKKTINNPDDMSSECIVLTRYLTGMPADEYVIEQYRRALELTGLASNPAAFSKILLRFGTMHPISARAADIFSRFFCSDSLFRKRLVLLLAILESYGPFSNRVDANVRQSKFLVISDMMLQGVISLLLLIIASLFLLPAKLLFKS